MMPECPSSVDVVVMGVSARRSRRRAMLHGTSCTLKARELFCLHGNTCCNHGMTKQIDEKVYIFPLPSQEFGDNYTHWILTRLTLPAYTALYSLQRGASTSVNTQQQFASNTLSSLTQQMASTCCQGFTDFFSSPLQRAASSTSILSGIGYINRTI